MLELNKLGHVLAISMAHVMRMMMAYVHVHQQKDACMYTHKIFSKQVTSREKRASFVVVINTLSAIGISGHSLRMKQKEEEGKQHHQCESHARCPSGAL